MRRSRGRRVVWAGIVAPKILAAQIVSRAQAFGNDDVATTIAGSPLARRVGPVDPLLSSREAELRRARKAIVLGVLLGIALAFFGGRRSA